MRALSADQKNFSHCEIMSASYRHRDGRRYALFSPEVASPISCSRGQAGSERRRLSESFFWNMLILPKEGGFRSPISRLIRTRSTFESHSRCCWRLDPSWNRKLGHGEEPRPKLNGSMRPSRHFVP